MARDRNRLGKNLASWLFLVLFCVTLPIAVLSGWARSVVVDVQEFGAALANLAEEGRVQSAVGRVVAARVASTVSGENPTATEALQSRLVGEVVREAMSGVVESAEFREIWEESTQDAHGRLTGRLPANQGQPVTLDFTPLYDNIEAEIASLDLELPPAFSFDAENLRIQVFDGETADRIAEAAALVERVFLVSLAVGLISLLLSIWLAADRLPALTRASFGLVLAMVALMALIVAGQGWIMGETGPEGGAAVAGVILDAISQDLRVATVALALLGLLLVVVFSAMRALGVGAPRRPPASTVA